jgi:hypothetical protein
MYWPDPSIAKFLAPVLKILHIDFDTDTVQARFAVEFDSEHCGLAPNEFVESCER